jgi:predicted acetyltransferase
MTVSLRDARQNSADLGWIETAYRDYLDDLGLLNTGMFPMPGGIEHLDSDPLQRWLLDRSALLITILDDHKPVGFAMVARDTNASRQSDYRMAEFFAGRWEIIEYMRNPAAVQFWRSVVSAYTSGRFRERIANGEVRQYFTSLQPRPAT